MSDIKLSRIAPWEWIAFMHEPQHTKAVTLMGAIRSRNAHLSRPNQIVCISSEMHVVLSVMARWTPKTGARAAESCPLPHSRNLLNGSQHGIDPHDIVLQQKLYSV